MGAAFVRTIRKLEAGSDLTTEDSEQTIATVLRPGTDPDLIARFLTAMAKKQPSTEELVGAVHHLRATATPVLYDGPALDIVGTGGDGHNTVNISTIAALMAAASGATVAKVGNRSATSRCGSADVLEALGIPLNDPDVPARLHSDKFAFLHSQRLHPALARIATVRRHLHFPTIFNLVGPLANPIRVTARVLGTTSRRNQNLLAQTVEKLGDDHTWVVTGHAGADELTTTGTAHILEVSNGHRREFTLDPKRLGLEPSRTCDLSGAGPVGNALLARELLSGRGPLAMRQTCLLNAAAGLHLAGIADGLAHSLELATTALADGAGLRLLHRLTGHSDIAVPQPTLVATQ